MKPADQTKTIIDDGEKTSYDLIEILQDIQAEYKYLPEEVLCQVSEKYQIPLIEVFRVANFYKSFTLEPRGKHLITICMGTACHVRGASKFLDEATSQLNISPGQTTEDKQFTLESVNCVGACALGPVVIMDGKYYKHMNSGKLRKLIQDTIKGDADEN